MDENTITLGRTNEAYTREDLEKRMNNIQTAGITVTALIPIGTALVDYYVLNGNSTLGLVTGGIIKGILDHNYIKIVEKHFNKKYNLN